MHSAICETYVGVMVFHRSIVNWSGGYMYPQYMCSICALSLGVGVDASSVYVL